MTKKKTYSFITEIAPETEIHLSGRYGQPLNISIDDGSSSKNVLLDTESVIRLQAFLSDYLIKEEKENTAPVFVPTGRAIAIMDSNTLDILRVFRTASIDCLDGAETDTYESLCAKLRSITGAEFPDNAVLIFFDTFDGTISQSVIRRILRASISYQVDFVRTGDLSRSRRMILEDIESFTTIDKSVVSRATRDVLVLSSAGLFTMNNSDASLDRPSLFDEGSKTVGGQECSRKAVLSKLRDLLEGEDKAHPYTDDEMSEMLACSGYDIARRTVVKYREILGYPNSAKRRQR